MKDFENNYKSDSPKFEIGQKVFYISDNKIEETYITRVIREEFLTNNKTGKSNYIETLDKYKGGFSYLYCIEDHISNHPIDENSYFKSKKELIDYLQS